MLNIRPLSIELTKIAKKELSEVPERIPNDVKALRAWLDTQPHLNPNLNDQFVVSFLRGCKYSLERTKEKIDTYFTMKTAMPEILVNRDPTDPILLKLIRLGIFIVLPFSAKPGGPKVLLVRFSTYKPGQYKASQLMTIFSMVLDVSLRCSDSFSISGQLIFWDLTDCTWGHLLDFEPKIIKLGLSIIQFAMPARLKGIHVYQPPTGFETFAKIMLSFLSEKNRKRFVIHGDDIKSLYKFIPQRILPAEYGGEAGPIQDIIDDWEKQIMESRSFILEMDSFASDESKRPTDGKNYVEMGGSFRNLEVD